MVGGGRGAFIGGVHRKAIALDGEAVLVAGALSVDPEQARASGLDLGLDAARAYGTWPEMLEGELALPPEERVEFVSIVTPNHVHYEVAKAFSEAGIHVVCDKPLVNTEEQAEDLAATAARQGIVFAVTYNYTGYPLVRQAREMVRNGEIGELRKVIVEYNQGWLARAVEETGNQQAEWRTDPARSGVAGAIGDIGSHAENLAAAITGKRVTHICADLTSFVEGRRLDDDGNALLRFEGGARGVLVASQVEIGAANDLRIRVFGTDGSLDWRQEEPNELIHDALDQPRRVLRRGNAYLCAAAQKASRIPAGHPEGYLEAFANVYLGVFEAIRAAQSGAALGPLEGDYPTVEDGARGVRFIHATVRSAQSDAKWTEVTSPSVALGHR